MPKHTPSSQSHLALHTDTLWEGSTWPGTQTAQWDLSRRWACCTLLQKCVHSLLQGQKSSKVLVHMPSHFEVSCTCAAGGVGGHCVEPAIIMRMGSQSIC